MKTKFPVDYSQYPVYQAWEVKYSSDKLLTRQYIVLKNMVIRERCLDEIYKFYIVSNNWRFEQDGLIVWHEVDHIDFREKLKRDRMETTSVGYRLENLYEVSQVFGPEKGHEFPDFKEDWRLIEVCELIYRSMPLLLSVVYEGSEGHVDHVFAYPGDTEFTDWDKLEYPCTVERLMHIPRIRGELTCLYHVGEECVWREYMQKPKMISRPKPEGMRSHRSSWSYIV